MRKYFLLMVIFLNSFSAFASPTAEEEKLFDEMINKLEKTSNPEKKNCPDYPEKNVLAPLSDDFPKLPKKEFVRCPTRDEGYQYCVTIDTNKPQSIEFQNTGNSKLIPEASMNRARTWRFKFPYQARQDMYFSVTDEPDHHNSQLRDSYFYIFPRKNTPAIRVDGDKYVVTLPTGEEVFFDAKTKDLLPGGVLKETGPLAKVSKELDPPKIKYTGSGVVVRVNARGSDPRLGAGTATITKQGKTCEVAKKDLWPDQSSDSSLHFKYSRDEDFDSYLKKKCGFGIN